MGSKLTFSAPAPLSDRHKFDGFDSGVRSRALFQDAARRVIHASELIGVRGLLAHAISDDAKAFYLRLGLDRSPLDPMTLMTTVADLKAALAP